MNGIQNSSVFYACVRANEALRRIKELNDEVHDGMGEDEVVENIFTMLLVAVEHFDKTYLDVVGCWYAGMCDYDVWDNDDLSARAFYDAVCWLSIGGASRLSVHPVVDVYATSNGWKPGAGGER